MYCFFAASSFVPPPKPRFGVPVADTTCCMVRVPIHTTKQGSSPLALDMSRPLGELWALLARIDGLCGRMLGRAVAKGFDDVRAWVCCLVSLRGRGGGRVKIVVVNYCRKPYAALATSIGWGRVGGRGGQRGAEGGGGSCSVCCFAWIVLRSCLA